MGHNILNRDITIRCIGGSGIPDGVESMGFEGNMPTFEDTFQGIPNVGVNYLSIGSKEGGRGYEKLKVGEAP